MKSKIFYTEEYKDIENKIRQFLNAQKRDYLGIASNTSVRTAGDKIPIVINKDISNIIGIPIEKSNSRNSMYNFLFADKDKYKYYVNILTHRIETQFNMPNITSVGRLIELYKYYKNYFIILLVSYESTSDTDFIKDIHFKPIEFFSWDCLGIGALGTGQIQIKNAKNIKINENYSRKAWMLEFTDRLNEFYMNEAKKTVNRMKKNNKIRIDWKAKKDIWI